MKFLLVTVSLTTSNEKVVTMPSSHTSRSSARLLREVAVILVLALLVSVVMRNFVVQSFWIPSHSMENTLLVGDRVLISKLTPGPLSVHRGDIVVFADPGGWLPPEKTTKPNAVKRALIDIGVLPDNSRQYLIKRVVGLPGDTVSCCDAQGHMLINGIAVDEEYLKAGVSPSSFDFSVTVPAGHVWVEGDNRSNSEDSRYHQDLPGNGSVAISDISGKADIRIYPLSRLGWLNDYHDDFAAVDAAKG